MKKTGTVIGLIQMQCSSDPTENMHHAEERVREAASFGASIICLPELFLSPYFCQKKDDTNAFSLAETIPGKTTNALSALAKDLGIVLIGGSLFEKTTDGKYYNTAPVFGPDGALMGAYRKTHIPEDPCFHEQHYFSPGDTGIQVFHTPFGNIAVLICYDQWFPEAARIATLLGAEILFYPTAIGNFTDGTPEEGNWQEAWETVQRGHAIANTVFVATVNRVGTEENIQFWGGSFVSNDFGTLLSHAGDREEILLAECDLSRIAKTQEGWGFFRNRRPKEYDIISDDGTQHA